MATVLQRDIIDALRKLRDARTADNSADEAACERRLNVLLDRLIASQIQKQKSDYEKSESDY